MRGILIAGAVALAAAVGGCAGHSSPSASTTLPGASTSTAPTSTDVVPATSAAPEAQTLPVTTGIRAQLLAAGAASHGLAASDYLGLRPGETYYAVDATGVHWAGAGLEP